MTFRISITFSDDTKDIAQKLMEKLLPLTDNTINVTTNNNLGYILVSLYKDDYVVLDIQIESRMDGKLFDIKLTNREKNSTYQITSSDPLMAYDLIWLRMQVENKRD